MARKKNVDDKTSALELTLDENLHAEVQEILNKNIITDEDVEKYNMSKDASLSVGDFIDLMNKAFDADIKSEEIAQEVLSE